MSDFQPRVTKNRLLAGIAVLVVASVILIALGVEAMPFFQGVALGIVILGAVVGIMVWRRRSRRST